MIAAAGWEENTGDGACVIGASLRNGVIKPVYWLLGDWLTTLGCTGLGGFCNGGLYGSPDAGGGTGRNACVTCGWYKGVVYRDTERMKRKTEHEIMKFIWLYCWFCEISNYYTSISMWEGYGKAITRVCTKI